MVEQTCKEHSGLRSSVDSVIKTVDAHARENREDHTSIWGAVDNLRNRLPLWATILIALLFGIVGWSLSK